MWGALVWGRAIGSTPTAVLSGGARVSEQRGSEEGQLLSHWDLELWPLPCSQGADPDCPGPPLLLDHQAGMAIYL